jgi:hypothetical protein
VIHRRDTRHEMQRLSGQFPACQGRVRVNVRFYRPGGVEQVAALLIRSAHPHDLTRPFPSSRFSCSIAAPSGTARSGTARIRTTRSQSRTG